jgi:RNA 2',3'-cyclic 3'-phosphodiesterase
MSNGLNPEPCPSLRAFVALPLSESTIQQLASLQTQLSAESVRQATRLRLVPAHQFHVTLAFLGTIARSRVDLVIGAVNQVATQFAAFRLTAKGLVIFPSIQRARVVGIALEDTDASLLQAVTVLHASLRELGFALESRAFRAHITLARLRSPGRFSFEPADIGTFVQPITCTRITVYKSELGATGSKYHELCALPLGS